MLESKVKCVRRRVGEVGEGGEKCVCGTGTSGGGLPSRGGISDPEWVVRQQEGPNHGASMSLPRRLWDDRQAAVPGKVAVRGEGSDMSGRRCCDSSASGRR